MAKSKRNIGMEILKGIREIKRGEHGRVITVPPVSTVRESTGLSQSQFAELLGVSVRAAGMGTGSSSAIGRCSYIAAHRSKEPAYLAQRRVTYSLTSPRPDNSVRHLPA